MDTYGIFILPFTMVFISVITFNLLLWTCIEKENESVVFLIFVFTLSIIMFSFMLWAFTTNKILFLFALLMFLGSYLNLCVFHKKVFNDKQYIIFFTLLTIFFVIWITVLFGKFYYDNKLIETWVYQSKIAKINRKYNFPLFYDFHLSLIFFDIGFEKYFTIPKNIELYDIQFIQFIFGFIISGTIISGIFDFIKNIIFPEN